MLVRSGVEERRIKLDYQQAADEALIAPLSFQLFLNATPSNFDRTAFMFTDMTYSDANFSYNSAEFRPGDQFVTYADSVKNLLPSILKKLSKLLGIQIVLEVMLTTILWG
ncbi:MAG: hypothetical protein HC892_02995 [Saprospiraceae bacterium]|nr:hypothetical protein [Saprospiraceae bacterium]